MANKQIIANTLNNWVLEYVEDRYAQIVNSFRLDIDRLKAKLTRDQLFHLDQFNKLTTQLKVLFSNLITSRNTNKMNLIVSIKEFNDILQKMDTLNTDMKTDYSDFYLNMMKTCQDINKKLANWTIDVLDLYESIINAGKIIIKRPVIGLIEITVGEMERVLERSGTNLYEFIQEIIDKFDWSPYNLRTDQLFNVCKDELSPIHKDKLEEQKKIVDFYPLVNEIVKMIQDSNIRMNDDLKTFVNLLNEVLGIYVDIEILPADTSRDELYAQIFDVCVVNPVTNEQRRQNLIQIGLLLGYDVNQLQLASDDELCGIYISLFVD